MACTSVSLAASPAVGRCCQPPNPARLAAFLRWAASSPARALSSTPVCYPFRVPDAVVTPANLSFSIYGDGPDNRQDSQALLPDHDAAWDYGEAIIRNLLQSDLDAHASRLMVIAQGPRVIASIAFNLAGLREPRKLQ